MSAAFWSLISAYRKLHTVLLRRQCQENGLLTSYKRIFLCFFVFWKVVKKTKMHPLKHIDLDSGKAEIDALEETWVERKPRNIFEKVR